MRNRFILIFFFSITLSFSQSFKGVVLDSITGVGIADVHVHSLSGNHGTITNEEGRFRIINSSNEKDSLRISHIGYEALELSVKEFSINYSDTLYLKPNLLELQGVTVTNDGVSEMIRDIMETLKKSQIRNSYAFYRQTSFKDTIATEWIEAFYKITHSKNGIDKIKIDQARFARKRSDSTSLFLIHSNFSSLTLTPQLYSPVLKTNEVTVGKPFGESFIKNYQFYIEKSYQKNKSTYHEIHFEPDDDITNPINSYGSFVYIPSEKKLVQYTVFIDHALGSDDLSNYKGDKKLAIDNTRHKLQFNYSEITGHLDFINVEYFYDFIENDVVFPCRVASKFIIYKNAIRPHKKLRTSSLELEDVRNFEKAKYKPRFWRDNPVIYRTERENLIISSFEKENAFGTYFKGN